MGEDIEVQPLAGLVEGIQKKVGTLRIKKDRRAAIGRERQRMSMTLLVDADPPHTLVYEG